MRSATALLAEVEQRGGRAFITSEGRVAIEPAAVLDQHFLAELRASRGPILEELYRRTEWRIDGCPSFTVLHDSDPDAESSRGACISCGASWRLHGSPEYGDWRRVQDPDDVTLVAIRYVVSAAREIVRESVR